MLPPEGDKESDGLSEPQARDVSTAASGTIYHVSPGRVIVTPDTPFGHIDRDLDTAANLWQQLGLSLPPVSKSDSTPSKKDRSTLTEQHVDRGRRGVLKGNILANRNFSAKFLSEVSTDADVKLVFDAIQRIDIKYLGLSEPIPEKFYIFVLLAKRQAMLGEKARGLNEKELLRRLCGQFDESAKILKTLSTHKTLQAPFDRTFGDSILDCLRNSRIDVLFEVDEAKQTQMKKLLYFGSPSVIFLQCMTMFTDSAKLLLETIETAGKVVEYSKYKFVDDLAQLWLAFFGNMPEIGRWSAATLEEEDSLDFSSPIRRFPEFVFALKQQVSAETIRTVLEAFKDARREDQGVVGNEEPGKS